MDIRVGLIGCGLMGAKRAQALPGARLVACTDIRPDRAKALAERYPQCQVYEHALSLIADPQVNVIIIATQHHTLADMTRAAIEANKHVLVEKPAARTANELIPLIALLKKHPVCVRVGFNHRYHRAFQQAQSMILNGDLGTLMYLRARYGHGGRLGYDKEWRADPALSGGGELIDQGVHLIDLSRWILGDFTEVSGFAHTYYWDMPVDDNGFLLLKTAQQQVAFLHASCTEWKNIFSMEIYGKKGKLTIEGLGGSYGTERLIWHDMLPTMGPPNTTMWEYPMADNSWEIEWEAFMEDIRLKREPSASLKDAYEALNIVGQIYEGAKHDCYA